MDLFYETKCESSGLRDPIDTEKLIARIAAVVRNFVLMFSNVPINDNSNANVNSGMHSR